MAIEAGATSGVCMPDMTTVEYLWPFIGNTGGQVTPNSSEKNYETKEAALADFSQWASDSNAEYAGSVNIDCTALEPLATVGFKPDEVKPVRELKGVEIDQVYIGSCTNGRIEDLRAAASVLKGKKIAAAVRAIVSPATTDVYAQALREGLIQIFMEAGCCVTNATCGACLGMSNGVLAEGEVCASTTNRNFYGRMGSGGMVHLMSPASAAAAALAGFIVRESDV
jgi:3-isopropylmalate/(R)-2-methylmalate dehydratase large subunit